MLYAIIPAAGIGSRMQSSIPKQYLPLLDGNVLLYSIRALLALPEIKMLMIALAPHDHWWPQTEAMLRADERRRIQTCSGGAERWQSVLAALYALTDHIGSSAEPAAVTDSGTHGADSDAHWVLVHDAVRPCVRSADLKALLHSCMPDSNTLGSNNGSAHGSNNTDNTSGGTADGTGSATGNNNGGIKLDGALLASPVADTLKKADPALKVMTTVDRSQLWAACTPQMFHLTVLQQALVRAAEAGVSVTDEASAMEFCGFQPTLVPCAKDNIKITYPEDLNLAALILQARS